MEQTTEILQALQEVLHQEQEKVSILLDYSHQKLQCMSKGTDQEIPELLKLESAVVGEIDDLEDQRGEKVAALAEFFDGLGEKASIREIIDVLPSAKWRNGLNQAREQLIQTIDQLKESNKKVNMLLRQKLKYTDTMLDLLLVPDTLLNTSYDQKGKRETEDIVKPGFLDVYI
jgi:flagellar biosynthesis/type III secretory pathway chaperone